MSGHSKWSQIKHKKGIEDQKRGALFSKLSKLIILAARKGPDPDKNLELKNAVERARSFNMPKENIERAIKKVSDKNNSRLEEVIFESVGFDSVNLIISAITDNKNRTLAEIRKILTDYGFKTVQPGSLIWSFDKTSKGLNPKYPVTIGQIKKEKLAELIEALSKNDDVQDIYANVL